MGIFKKLGKKANALTICLLVFFVITLLHLLGVFNYLEYRSYDLRVRLTAEYTHPSEEIAVILLTQDCLDWAQRERGWGWPWPRQAYAEIVEYMNISGANGIAFDVLFSEPSIYRNARQDEIIDGMIQNMEIVQDVLYGEQRRETAPMLMGISNALRRLSERDDDASFVRAKDDYGKVVQAVFFSSQMGNVRTWPLGFNPPLFQTENFGYFINRFDVAYDIEGDVRAQFPIPELMEASAVLGGVTGSPDSDGVIRRLKLFTSFDGRAIPGLGPALLMLSDDIERQVFHNERNRTLEWDRFSIPVDRNGSTLLRYRGELERYHPNRAMDIILSREAIERGETLEYGWHTTELGTEWVKWSADKFTGTYVFFGFYAPGLFDIFNTPISSVYAGMGCHITFLDNMLQGDFIRESTLALNLLILLAVVALIVILTMFSNHISVSVGGTVFIVAAIVAASFGAYLWGGLWLPMVTYLAGIFAAFITVTLYNYMTEGSQKRFIKSAFSQYLSPKVIDQIIADPSQLKLGGEKREMTAIFTDIRGFSTFSEALGDPSQLVELLNFYLTKMSNIVMDNQGTIDKYEGDAIIAFFGAPVHFKDHASLACRAAVGMKKAEPEINREAIETGLVTPEVIEAMYKKGLTKGLDDPCQIFTRIGVNSGDMVVGNMGTPNKMDYTIMGNAVNLAARLEGVNKQYCTGGILISEYTRALIGDDFILRPLSRVRVVGVNTPLRLFEVLDVASDASPELLEMVKSWLAAFDLYEKKDFASAKNIFDAIYSKNNEDLAAKKYLDRCAKYAVSPPDEKAWDNGVDNLTEK